MQRHDIITAYEKWLATEAGAFALHQEKKCIAHLLQAWPRRGYKLLELGCGDGQLLEFFCDAGFDCTGLDSRQTMLQKTKQRLHSRANLLLGREDHLPVADKSFEYISIINNTTMYTHQDAVLEEAFRVATHGIIIAFFNRYSLAWLVSHLFPLLQQRIGLHCEKDALQQMHWISTLKLKNKLLLLSDNAPISIQSTLIGPYFSWSPTSKLHKINSQTSALPCGAFTAVRIDLRPPKGCTPLLLKTVPTT